MGRRKPLLTHLKWRSSNIFYRLVPVPCLPVQLFIEYVVAHELIHLEEDNHSKKFWAKLSSVIPDYNERDEWLKKNSPKLIFSKDDL